MEILKNNYDTHNYINIHDDEEIEVICENCGSVLKVTSDDIEHSDCENYVICPCCGNETYEGLNKVVTKRNIEFPDDFYHFSSSTSSNIDDEKINKWVKECIKKIDENNEDYHFVGCGDTMVVVFRFEDGYEVIVAKDYYEREIDSEYDI